MAGAGIKKNLNETDSKIYTKIKQQVSIFDISLNFIVLLVLSFSPISNYIFSIVEKTTSSTYLQFLMYIIIIGLIFTAIALPINFYSSYILEHDFKLSNQNRREWLKENLKSLVVSSAIGLPIALIFYSLLRITGENWWLFFGLIMLSISIILAKIAPIIIFPLFYKFTPVEDEKIKKRIMKLLKKNNIEIQGIFSFDMSKNTKKANAAFTGIGKSKRIILSDTLLKDFTDREIEVIFAHEMGHYHKKHIIKNILLSSIIILSSFFICGKVYSMTILNFGYLTIDMIPALPILFLYLSIFSIITLPFTNHISRKYEIEADLYALKTTENPKAFISSMEKLSIINLADKSPNPVIEFIFYSHPAISKRIQMAEDFSLNRKKFN